MRRLRNIKCQDGKNRFTITDKTGEVIGGFNVYLESNRVLIELNKETREQRKGTDFLMWVVEE